MARHLNPQASAGTASHLPVLNRIIDLRDGRGTKSFAMTSRMDSPSRGGVQIDQLPQPVGHPLGHARNDHSSVAVPSQNDVVQVLVREDVEDVLHVTVQGQCPSWRDGRVRRAR
jgi:hypothetical protein